jgi:hypothetical protein
MKLIEEKTIPKSIKNFTSWEVSRRSFIKNALAIGALSQMTLLQSCINEDKDTNLILSKKQMAIAISIQNIVFPKDELSPGAIDFNADKYLLWVLSDTRLDPDENQYIIDGINWVNETAEEEMKNGFLNLSKKEQVQLIHVVSQKSWGESWLSVMLTFIFEAMISDPIYGFNKDAVGWKWLDHQVGLPRPTKTLQYPEILDTVRKNRL